MGWDGKGGREREILGCRKTSRISKAQGATCFFFWSDQTRAEQGRGDKKARKQAAIKQAEEQEATCSHRQTPNGERGARLCPGRPLSRLDTPAPEGKGGEKLHGGVHLQKRNRAVVGEREGRITASSLGVVQCRRLKVSVEKRDPKDASWQDHLHLTDRPLSKHLQGDDGIQRMA